MKSLVFLLCSLLAGASQAELSATPVGPSKLMVAPKPIHVAPSNAIGADLAIDSANQTSPNFWIVRVKNIGGGTTAATTVRVTLKIWPTNGGSPTLVGLGSAALPALEHGKLADVNVVTNVNSNSTMTAEISVNPDKNFLETNYGNNYMSKTAGY